MVQAAADLPVNPLRAPEVLATKTTLAVLKASASAIISISSTSGTEVGEEDASLEAPVVKTSVVIADVAVTV